MTAFAPQHPNPFMQIRAGAWPEQVPLLQQRGQLGRQLAQPQGTAFDHHMGQARVEAQLPGRLSVVCDGSLGIQQIQPLQQLHRLLPVRIRRGINPTHLLRGTGPPLGQFQHQRRQVGFLDFRRRVVRQPELLRLTPQPVTHTRLNPTGPALALLGRRL